MRLLFAVSMIALAAACSRKENAVEPETAAPAAVAEKSPATHAAPAAPLADLQAMRAQFAKIEMAPDVSFLSPEDRQIVNLLIEAADYMSEIYLRQRGDNLPALRAEIAASARSDTGLLLELFDLHGGVWDETNHNEPFYGEAAWPAGAGFYPADMTKAEFEAWIAAHPEDAEAFNSPYTVIRREGDRLVAVPYSVAYREWLEPAAAKLREAAAVATNESLKKFLTMRADSFLKDDYYDSEMAWMDLDGPIEIAIGPYETYTDTLFGMKTAFEAFVTVKDPAESAALAKYKNYLKDMEANLPVEEKYKNFKRGFESPIAVVAQVHGGGDNVPGIQTIAFNLPNDERVREAKGAKKVLLSNVMGAKFDRILSPMAAKVLVDDQAGLLMQKYMGAETLFHELSHSIGPGAITKDGRETTVTAELKELHAPIEEGKADVLGAYNVLFMMQRGEMPIAEKENFLATYFVGIFRAMRFGVTEAHGRGAAFQYKYFRDRGAAVWDAEAKRYRLDFVKLEQAITDLTRDVIVIEGNGDYAAAAAFLEANAALDGEAKEVIAGLTDLPVDIQPVYPKRI
ncbi:MAG: hypothetical protein HXY23_00715 [Parvularculaceae bacterium]|nr:hypothetical protein [Parvularculaceae bacterium]